MKKRDHHKFIIKVCELNDQYYKDIERLERYNLEVLNAIFEEGILTKIIDNQLGWYLYNIRMRKTFTNYYFVCYLCLFMSDLGVLPILEWVIDHCVLTGNVVYLDYGSQLSWPDFVSDLLFITNDFLAPIDAWIKANVTEFNSNELDLITNFMGAEEKVLRRVRIADLLLYCDYADISDRWWLSDLRNTTWNVNLFLLKLCNDFAYTWLHTLSHEDMSDRAKYRKAVAGVGDRLKVNYADVHGLCLVELKHLTGHQVILEDFDPYEQVEPFQQEAMLKGPNKSDFLMRLWNKYLYAFDVPIKLIENDFVDFYHFYTQGHWESSGSSDVKIEAGQTIDGVQSTKRLKVRRNFLLAYLDYDSLCRHYLRWLVDYLVKRKVTGYKAVMNVIVKRETGKIRFAYGTSDHVLFSSKYILEFCNKCYNLWPGVDILRKPIQEFRDDYQFAVDRKWYLFFDFKAFDTQISLWEQCIQLSAMVYILLTKYSDVSYPGLSGMLKFFLMYLCWCIFHFDMYYKGKSMIDGVENDVEFEIRVSNALLSGVPFTSLFGSGFNSQACQLVLDEILSLANYVVTDLDNHNLGDDKQLRSHNWRFLECANMLFSGWGFKAGVGKYGMLKERGEFLRKYMVNGVKIGWVNRAINGISQQKPWRPEPPNDIAGLGAMWTNVLICFYRSPDGIQLVKWFLFHCVYLCNKFGIPFQLLNVPQSLGGLGLFIWDGKFTGSVKINAFVPDITLPPVSDVMKDKYRRSFNEIGYAIPEDLLDRSLQKMMLRKITMSDVGELKPSIRRHYLRFIKKIKLRPVRGLNLRINFTLVMDEVFTMIASLKVDAYYLHNFRKMFRSRLRLFNRLHDEHIYILDLIDDDDEREFLKDEYINENYSTLLGEMHWTCGKKIKLKFLSGHISIPGYFHPGVSDTIKYACAFVLEKFLHKKIGKFEFYYICAYLGVAFTKWFFVACPIRGMFRY